jgi:hypothetical protein
VSINSNEFSAVLFSPHRIQPTTIPCAVLDAAMAWSFPVNSRFHTAWVDSVEKLASKISGRMKLEKLAATI